MTQKELNRIVAHETGESIHTIARRGFSLPLTTLEERDGLLVDWDALDEQRLSIYPKPRPRGRRS